MMAREVLRTAEERMKKTLGVCRSEFAGIRTGRASPALVEEIKVDYFGAPTPLKKLASISTPEPRLIVIQPWDPSTIEGIEKALLSSNLGINPQSDGRLVRIALPQLTTERREELVKLVKKIVEEGKISIRSIRRDANEAIKELQKEKKITEDDFFRFKKEDQVLTDKYIGEVDKLVEEKEKEIREF